LTTTTYTILLFPDKLQATDITIENAQSRVLELLSYSLAVKSGSTPPPALPANVSPLPADKYVFVCTHKKRGEFGRHHDDGSCIYRRQR
jgi:hypothetical protein